MKKKTLGDVLKQRRAILGYTQRQLAARLGVKASHVAYLEKGRRRPSLSLLARLANVMGLEKEPLFLLAHPEARVLLADRNSNHNAERPENSWRKFLSNRGLLARHHVKARELRVLRQVSLLGRVASPRQFLWVLHVI